MKNLLFLLLSLFVTPLVAQLPSIDLPTFKQGLYIRDTINTFFIQESTDFTTIDPVHAEFITGVTFKILVDSIQIPNASSANGQALHKGDIIPFPANILLFAGVVRIRVLIEGTPQIGGESYLCELRFLLPVDQSSDQIYIGVEEGSTATCEVSIIESIQTTPTSTHQAQFYPNPFSSTTRLSFEAKSSDYYELTVFDNQGLLVLKESITDGEIYLNKQNLSNGIYFYQLKNEKSIVSTGKLMVE